MKRNRIAIFLLIIMIMSGCGRNERITQKNDSAEVEQNNSSTIQLGQSISTQGLVNIFVDENKAIILEIKCETSAFSKSEDFIKMFNIIGKSLLNSDAKTIKQANKISASNTTVGELITSMSSSSGENISIGRFEIITKNSNEHFGSYVHTDNKNAALVLLEGATDDVAKDIAMHTVSMKPLYVSISDVPSSVSEKKKSELVNQAMDEGYNEDIAQKIATGRLNKYYKDICLLEQKFIKDNSLYVSEYISKKGGSIKKVIYYKIG